jgi:uncharacterized protein (DUF1330 family)
MPVYAIAQGRIGNRQQFDQYVAAAVPTLQAHRARLIALDEAPVVIEGDVTYPRTVILEFESEQAFHDWYDSAEYRAARKLRQDASTGTFILVKGPAA